MKLFYKTGACSLASHIVLNELQLSFDLDLVDTVKGISQSAHDYTTINPKGYVPALQLNTGEVLTESAAILQYLADLKPALGLVPEVNSIDRVRLQEYLNYISSELHKAFSPLFTEGTSSENKQLAHNNIANKLKYLESVFDHQRPYLLGDTFTVADAYLFVVINWSNFVDLDLGDWPQLSRFYQRVSARTSVQKAMTTEGLL